MRPMRIVVNGETKEVPEGTTLTVILEQLKMAPKNVAVELNRRLLRTEKYGLPLNDGDAIEIVTFVGGG